MSVPYHAFLTAAANANIHNRSYLDKDQYSDLTVRSMLDDGETFRVHKVVLASHSYILRRALNQNPNLVRFFRDLCGPHSRSSNRRF